MTDQPGRGRRVYAAFHLLDRQIVDADGMLAGKVDDLELEQLGEGQQLYVTAILTGLGALGPRIGGYLGSWFSGVHRRLHPDPEPRPARIPFDAVKRINTEVELAVRGDQLENQELEAWVREHVIDHIPGAGHAPE
jgi:sporulation protein YlmC with PRC-barrel domain